MGDNNENQTLSDDAQLRTWKNHQQSLLNFTFPWDKNFLNNIEAVEGPEDMMMAVIKKLKQGKAGGLSGVIVEMIKAAVREIVTAITELMNKIMHEGNIPEDCKDSFIVNCYKGISDATDRGNYMGLRLLDHVMKDLERVLETFIRSQVDIMKYLRSLVL